MNIHPVPIIFGHDDRPRCGFCEQLVLSKTVEPVGWSIDSLGNRLVTALADVMEPCGHAWIRSLNREEVRVDDTPPWGPNLSRLHDPRDRDDPGRHVQTPP